MLTSNCQIAIELADDNGGCYTNGDIVHGTVITDNRKPVEIRSIEVSLICEEVAVVWVSNSQGSYSRSERMKLLSLNHRVFPPTDPPAVDGTSKPDDAARSTYRLLPRQRQFEFAFMIPNAGPFPGSLVIRNSRSKVVWYIKAVIRKSSVLPNCRAEVPFYMIPSSTHGPDVTELSTFSSVLPFRAHLPGCATGLRGLLPDSEHRRNTEVRLGVIIPARGLPQAPLPLCVIVNIDSNDSELLILRHFVLYLKQKTTVFVDHGWHRDFVRDRYPLIQIQNDMSLKDGVDAVKHALRQTAISDLLTESFDSPHFIHEYKLVVEAVVASRLRPSNKIKLRLSTPVHIFGREFGGCSASIFDDPLPVYAQHPRDGEELLSAPYTGELTSTPPPPAIPTNSNNGTPPETDRNAVTGPLSATFTSTRMTLSNEMSIVGM